MSGWKTIYGGEGPHYFERGRSLCGYFTVRNRFQAEGEPLQEDTCAKCWQISHRITSVAPTPANEMATSG
jgi:hypothetical protein